MNNAVFGRFWKMKENTEILSLILSLIKKEVN